MGLKNPYFTGTFPDEQNSSQAQKDFIGPGIPHQRENLRFPYLSIQQCFYDKSDFCHIFSLLCNSPL